MLLNKFSFKNDYISLKFLDGALHQFRLNTESLSSKSGVHNSNLMAGQTFFLQYSRAKKDKYLLVQKVFISSEEVERTKLRFLRAK